MFLFPIKLTSYDFNPYKNFSLVLILQKVEILFLAPTIMQHSLIACIWQKVKWPSQVTPTSVYFFGLDQRYSPLEEILFEMDRITMGRKLSLQVFNTTVYSGLELGISD